MMFEEGTGELFGAIKRLINEIPEEDVLIQINALLAELSTQQLQLYNSLGKGEIEKEFLQLIPTLIENLGSSKVGFQLLFQGNCQENYS